MSHLFFSHSAQTMLPHSIPGAHASPTHLLCPKLSISTDILKELVKCMAGCRAAVHEVTNTLPAVQPARLHHKLLGASKVRHALCATWSHTCILFSAAQKSQTGYSLCTEVPSYTHEQRLSPDTASSHVAPIDESAARVRCRAEWRQQSQAPAQPSLTECGWTLRAISTGKPVTAEVWLYANAMSRKMPVQHYDMLKLASTLHQCHHTAS